MWVQCVMRSLPGLNTEWPSCVERGNKLIPTDSLCPDIAYRNSYVQHSIEVWPVAMIKFKNNFIYLVNFCQRERKRKNIIKCNNFSEYGEMCLIMHILVCICLCDIRIMKNVNYLFKLLQSHGNQMYKSIFKRFIMIIVWLDRKSCYQIATSHKTIMEILWVFYWNIILSSMPFPIIILNFSCIF